MVRAPTPAAPAPAPRAAARPPPVPARTPIDPRPPRTRPSPKIPVLHLCCKMCCALCTFLALCWTNALAPGPNAPPGSTHTRAFVDATPHEGDQTPIWGDPRPPWPGQSQSMRPKDIPMLRPTSKTLTPLEGGQHIGQTRLAKHNPIPFSPHHSQPPLPTTCVTVEGIKLHTGLGFMSKNILSDDTHRKRVWRRTIAKHKKSPLREPYYRKPTFTPDRFPPSDGAPHRPTEFTHP